MLIFYKNQWIPSASVGFLHHCLDGKAGFLNAVVDLWTTEAQFEWSQDQSGATSEKVDFGFWDKLSAAWVVYLSPANRQLSDFETFHSVQYAFGYLHPTTAGYGLDPMGFRHGLSALTKSLTRYWCRQQAEAICRNYIFRGFFYSLVRNLAWTNRTLSNYF